MFQAKEKTILEILFGHERFLRIPEYQRPYSWGLDEINDFRNDIIENQNEVYFLGSFVLNKNENNNRIDIIDGQQRAITISIFIATIRDLFKQLGFDKGAEEVQDKYICDSSALTGSRTYRILPGDSTKAYFKKIQDGTINLENEIKKNNTKEEKKLIETYNFFTTKINEYLNENLDEDPIELLKYLLKKVTKLECIEIVVNDEYVAYTIFETVNARGADLSVSDLVKNIFFKYYDGSGQLVVAKKLWKELEDNINECGGDIPTFLRHYRLSKQKYISKRDLFKEIKRKVESDDYDEILKELVLLSNFYKIILKPSNFSKEDLLLPLRYDTEYEKDDIKDLSKIYQSLMGIEIFRIKQYAPIFLAIFKNYKSIIENVRPVKIVEDIEKFGYTFFGICSQPARAVEKECSRFAVDIWETSQTSTNLQIDLQQVYSRHKTFLKGNFPDFELFSANFNNLHYKKKGPLIKYTLQKISNQIEREYSVDDIVDYSKTNIEHILPQKPEQWGYSEKEVEEYVNSIGNLTLIGVRMNSILGNKTLKEKTEDENGFQKSKLSMTQHLVSQFKENNYIRNKKLIEERSEELCRTMYDMQSIK